MELVDIVNDMLGYWHDNGLSMKRLRKWQLTLQKDLSRSQLVHFEEEALFNAIGVKHVLYDLVWLLHEAFFMQDRGQYGIVVFYDLTEAQLLDSSAPQLLLHLRAEDFGLSQQQVTETETSQSSQGLEKVVIVWTQEHVFNPVRNCVEQGPELTIKQSNPLHICDDGLILPQSIWQTYAQNQHVSIDILQIKYLPVPSIDELSFQLITFGR